MSAVGRIDATQLVPPLEFLMSSSAVHVDESLDLLPLAVHEAGHAVTALSLNVRVFFATVQPRLLPKCSGTVWHSATTPQNRILITLAGPAAGQLFEPFTTTATALSNAKFDIEDVMPLIEQVARPRNDKEREAETARWCHRAEAILRREWDRSSDAHSSSQNGAG